MSNAVPVDANKIIEILLQQIADQSLTIAMYKARMTEDENAEHVS